MGLKYDYTLYYIITCILVSNYSLKLSQFETSLPFFSECREIYSK